jgi:hypothetical protein
MRERERERERERGRERERERERETRQRKRERERERERERRGDGAHRSSNTARTGPRPDLDVGGAAQMAHTDEKQVQKVHGRGLHDPVDATGLEFVALKRQGEQRENVD